MEKTIKDLKKNEKFRFNDTVYIVKQKFADWKKNGEPYLVTSCGEKFWYEELIVEPVN